MAPAMATSVPRAPRSTGLDHVRAAPLETGRASRAAAPATTGLPAYGQRDFDDSGRCGLLAPGGLRLGQAARLGAVVGRPPPGPEGGPSRRAGLPLGPHAAMGGGGAEPGARLACLLPRAARPMPSPEPHHACAG